jgi:glutamate carboxypeptidase
MTSFLDCRIDGDARDIATLDGLGIDGDGAHTNREHLLVSSTEPGTRLMQGLMETLAA